MSARASQKADRNGLLDLLRGVAIVEMVVAHIAFIFPPPLVVAIAYLETAMALFLVVSGWTVGWLLSAPRALPMMLRDFARRALHVWRIQYILILTLSLPLFAAGMLAYTQTDSVATFAWRSLLFLNQVPILHILPTFIAMFLLAPFALWLIHHGKALWLALISAMIAGAEFAGLWPAVLREPQIFPIQTFQLYFVCGLLIGAELARRREAAPNPTWGQVGLAAAVFALAAFAIFAKMLPAGSLKTHPLNAVGLIYHASLICFVILFLARSAPAAGNSVLFRGLQVLGRNAMLVFVLHAYVVLISLGVSSRFGLSPMTRDIMVSLGLIGVVLIVRRVDAAKGAATVPVWVGALKRLFS